MKKNLFKKAIALVLALVAVLSLVACGGGGTTTEKPDATKATDENGREHVTLSYFTYSPRMPGKEEMVEALNEYLKEKLNVTLDLHLSSDYNDTMGTRIDSGEQWDICLVGGPINFFAYADRNAFAPLTDYLDLMPETTGQLNSTGLTAFTVDDEVYAIPVLKDSFTANGIEINQTLLEDLGLEVPEFTTNWDLVDWLLNAKKVKDAKYPDDENIPLIKAVYGNYDAWFVSERIVGGWDLPLADVNIDEANGYKGIPLNDTVFCPFYTQEYRDLMKTINKLVEAGVGAFDSTTYDQDDIHKKAGRILGSWSSGLIEVPEDQYPNFKSKLYMTDVLYANYYQYGFAVNAKCENVERAVEVLELLQNDNYASTVMHFGKEGSGWTDENNDNVIELTDKNSDPTDRWWYNWYGWQLCGVTNMKAAPGYSTNYFAKIKEMNQTATARPNAGFVFDKEPVANQIAAVSNVVAEYHETLITGQNANVDQLVDEFVAALKSNGMDEIVEEAQRQLDAWREANGK